MPKPGVDPSSGISLGDVLRLPKRHPACRRREAQSGSKKKLTGSDVAANSSCWWCREHGSGGERLDLHDVAKVGQTFDQTFLLLVGGTAIEVIAAEVLVHRPILEHVVDRGKDGRDDSHNRLLGAAPGFDAVKLSL